MTKSEYNLAVSALAKLHCRLYESYVDKVTLDKWRALHSMILSYRYDIARMSEDMEKYTYEPARKYCQDQIAHMKSKLPEMEAEVEEYNKHVL